jgi:Immunity protein 26
MTRKPLRKKSNDCPKPPRIISDNGDLFIVLQGERRIALGLIARGGKKAGKLGYFFRIELYDDAKDKANLKLDPEQAIWIQMFGDLHILRGKWPIVGKLNDFNRDDWPMPVFAHRDDLIDVDYIRTYNEDSLEHINTWRADEVPAYVDTSVIADDGDAGAGFVEIYLMEMLGLRNQ